MRQPCFRDHINADNITGVVMMLAIASFLGCAHHVLTKGTNAAMTVVGQVTVPMHCHASLKEAVAAGNYREVNQYVDEQDFPSYHFACRESQESMYLVKFDRDMLGDDAIKKLDAAGLRPADLRELLALGEMNSTAYRESTTIALGSKMRDLDLSPYLYSSQSERDIGLHGDGESDIVSFGYHWHAGDLFLAVRK